MATFSNNLFSSASQVIFTDTLVPHLQVFSWRQSLDTHNSFQVMSLAIVRHIDTHYRATSSSVSQVLEKIDQYSIHFQVRRNAFRKQDHPRLNGATSTFI